MSSLIFKINFPFVCLFRSQSGEGWLIFSMLDVLFSRCVFIHFSLHESKAKVLGMPSPKMKRNESTLCCQIINFLESVGMEGTHYTVSHGKFKYGGKRNKLYFLFGIRL